MKNQNRTIMGALDYSLASLQIMKKTMMDISDPHKLQNWAVGGLIATLTSYLIHACHETFLHSAKSGEANADNDLRTIQTKFNEFMDKMINTE